MHLSPYRARIEPAWIDFNGHVRDAYYTLAASYAVDAVMDQLGLDAPYRERTHCTLYTVELHIHYLREVKSSDELTLHTSVLDFDRKRIHLGCRFAVARAPQPAALADLMLLHVHQGDTVSVQALPDAAQAMLAGLKLSPAAAQQFAPRSRAIALQRN